MIVSQRSRYRVRREPLRRKAEENRPNGKMYHLFRYGGKEFRANDHRRSTVETVFAELGIEPVFDGLSVPASKVFGPAS